MTHSFGNNEHVTFIELDWATLHLDAKMSLEDEKQLIFVFVTVLCQGTVDFCDLDVSVIDLGNHARRPELGQDEGCLFWGNNTGHIVPTA